MFEAYKIGIRLSLINHASLGLVSLSKDFMRTEEQAQRLQKRIDSIKNQALKGGLMLGLSGGIAEVLKTPYEEAKKLAQEQQKFESLNLSASDNATAFAQAQTLAHKNLGSTIGENIALIRDLHTAVGDLPGALRMSEQFQKFSVAARVQNDGKPVEGLVYNSVKALEHRGDRVAQDPEEMHRELDLMSQVYFGSGGKVGPNDYFHASQTGKLAYTMFDPKFLFGQFAAFMQAKTGPTAGTAAMTYVSSLLGGHMDNKGKGFMTSLGLWDMSVSPQTKLMQKAINDAIAKDPSIAAPLKKMHMLTPMVGGLAPEYLEMASSRPDEFIQKVIAPRIRQRFGMDLTDEQVAGIVMRNFNRNTADFIGSFITSQHKYEKDAKIFGNAKGVESAYQQYIKSPEGAEIAADAAWKNFLAVFGSVYLPVITSGLLKLAGALDSLSQTVEKHPGAFRALAYSLMFVSAGLGLRGGGLLLSAAFRGLGLALAMQGVGGAAGIARMAGALGLAAPALTAVGTAIAVAGRAMLLTPIGLVITGIATAAFILWKNWDTVGPKLEAAWNFISNGVVSFINKMIGYWNQVASFLHLSTMTPLQIPQGVPAGPTQSAVPAGRGEVAPTSKYIQHTGSGNINLRGNVNIDGRKMGDFMADHLGREATRPQNMPGTFDGSMNLRPMGMR